MPKEPAPTPVTTPVEPTVASEVLALLQVPPVVASPRVMVAPTHTVVGPVTVPAVGSGLTVMVRVATTVPHVLVTEYDITAVPASNPVTTPLLLTEAMVGTALLHVPPVTVEVSGDVVPTQTAVAPLKVPALAAGFTIIPKVAVAVPQAVDTM